MAAPEVAPPDVNTPLQAGHGGNSLSSGAAIFTSIAHDDTGLSVLIKIMSVGRSTDSKSISGS